MENRNLLLTVGALLASRRGWRCMYIGTLIWAIETLYFIHGYGWHWMPINDWEVFCDAIAGLFLLYGLKELITAAIVRHGIK